MRIKNQLSTMFNTKLIVESAPSLLISLVGMLITGLLFESSVRQKRYSIYPIILESGCILSFKGNIELSLAMYLSTLRTFRSPDVNFVHAAFYNSCSVIAQSFITGFVAGLIGTASSALKKTTEQLMFLRIVTASMLTCCLTTLIFLVILLIVIEVAYILCIHVENFILPILSTLNDFLIVQGLLLSTKFVEYFTVRECLLTCLAMFGLFSVATFFTLAHMYANNTVLISQPEILGISYLVTVLSSFVLERCSATFRHVATVFPVFAGMCGAILYIHAHRRFTFLQTNEPEIPPTYPTLLLISLIVAIVYICLAKLLDFKFSTGFCLLFIFLFIAQVSVLLFIIETISTSMRNSNKPINTDALPIIACTSDLLAVIVLVASSIALKDSAT